MCAGGLRHRRAVWPPARSLPDRLGWDFHRHLGGHCQPPGAAGRASDVAARPPAAPAIRGAARHSGGQAARRRDAFRARLATSRTARPGHGSESRPTLDDGPAVAGGAVHPPPACPGDCVARMGRLGRDASTARAPLALSGNGPARRIPDRRRRQRSRVAADRTAGRDRPGCRVPGAGGRSVERRRGRSTAAIATRGKRNGRDIGTAHTGEFLVRPSDP